MFLIVVRMDKALQYFAIKKSDSETLGEWSEIFLFARSVFHVKYVFLSVLTCMSKLVLFQMDASSTDVTSWGSPICIGLQIEGINWGLVKFYKLHSESVYEFNKLYLKSKINFLGGKYIFIP